MGMTATRTAVTPGPDDDGDTAVASGYFALQINGGDGVVVRGVSNDADIGSAPSLKRAVIELAVGFFPSAASSCTRSGTIWRRF